MQDLSTLTHERLAACLSQTFALDWGPAQTIPTQLIEVTPRGRADPNGGRRQAFSAVFRAPREPVLPQGIYPVQIAALGSLDLFLVPVGQDAAGTLYEAVFN